MTTSGWSLIAKDNYLFIIYKCFCYFYFALEGSTWLLFILSLIRILLTSLPIFLLQNVSQVMKPWNRTNNLRKLRASAESSRLLLGRPGECTCLTSLFLPCRVQWHVISTGWKPRLSSSVLCPTLNISRRLGFTQGLAKCRGEKTWEGVWHEALVLR